MIVIEGIDGTGKTTVANIVAEMLGGAYIPTPAKEMREIRKHFNKGDPTAKYLFYLASLVDLTPYLFERLLQGYVVVDRYLATTICYHKAAGVQTEIIDWQKLPIVKPDIQFCLEVSDRKEWLRRIIQRDGHECAIKTEREFARLITIAKLIKEFILGQGGEVIDTSLMNPEQAAERIVEQINK